MNPDRHNRGPSACWIVDIDGTLMPSQHMDNQCYWQAVFEQFGQEPQTLDLHDFEHVTDGGILREWMLQQHGRSATAGELLGIRRRFLELITRARHAEPQAFTASPGLFDWLDHQLATGGPCVAIATGGWGHTARFKLEAAGLHDYQLPLASSDDGDSRQEIMRHALARLQACAGSPARDSEDLPVCYIGDGLWDYRAARDLGWDFIGIAAGEQAQALRRAGAEKVYCNFAQWLASNSYAAIAH